MTVLKGVGSGGGGTNIMALFRMRRLRLPFVLAICLLIGIWHIGFTRIEDIAVKNLPNVKDYTPQALWPSQPQTPQSVPDPAPPPSDAKQPPISDRLSAALEGAQLKASAYEAAQKDLRPPSNPNSAARPDPVFSPSDTTQEELHGFRMHGEGRKLPPPPIDGAAVIQQWTQLPEHFPVKSADITPLPTGSPAKLPAIQYAFGSESAATKTTRQQRQEHVKKEFEHAWAGYKKHAWMHDELLPVANLSTDPFMGWAATLVDSLDTLWIMGMKADFEDAVNAVAEINFHTSARSHIPVFETTIRYLGGLLGAYDVSGGKYPILLDQAVKVGDILLDSFDTPNRMPVLYHSWMTTFRDNPQRASSRSNLAELGSLSMEFTRLAQLTKQNKYYDAVARVTNALAAWQKNTKIPGLWPFEVDASGCKKPDPPRPSFSEEEEVVGIAASNAALEAVAQDEKKAGLQRRQINPNKMPPQPEIIKSDGQRPPRPNEVDCEPNGLASPPGNFQETFGMGGNADSTYEYLLKQYLLLGGAEPVYKTMYEAAATAAAEKLVYRPMTPHSANIRALGLVHSLNAGDGKLENRFQAKLEHLSCFAGGMFAMGSKTFSRSGDLDLGTKLTEGCVWAYGSTYSGIMADDATMMACEDVSKCEWNVTRWKHDVHTDVLTALTLVDESQPNDGPAIIEAPTPPNTPPSSTPQSQAQTLTKRQHGYTADKTPILSPSAAELLEKKLGQIDESTNARAYIRFDSAHYILRPEALESVWIMYRMTGDETWRDKGWAMYEAIIKNTRTPTAHSAIASVMSKHPKYEDSMQSFWLAETLKYAYLLFSEPSVISLDEYVFNTEAHPFKRPK